VHSPYLIMVCLSLLSLGFLKTLAHPESDNAECASTEPIQEIGASVFADTRC